MAKRTHSVPSKMKSRQVNLPQQQRRSTSKSIASRRRQIWPIISSDSDAQALAMQVQFRETERWAPKRLLAHQLYQIQNLVEYAEAVVPFYKDRLAPLRGLKASQFTFDRFREIPILSRDEVRQAGAQLNSRRLPPKHRPTYQIKTSGSTSKPLEILGTRLTRIMGQAISHRTDGMLSIGALGRESNDSQWSVHLCRLGGCRGR